MSLLTQRALRVFSVLEAYRGADDDIVDALLPFFEPILEDLAGKIFSPVDFAAKIRESYRWNFTSDIAEELIPRFVKKDWLTEIGGKNSQAKAFQITYRPKPRNGTADKAVAIEQTLSQIVQEFQNFIRQISPLTGYNRSTEELSDLLVEWLVSIDAYNEDVLRQEVRKIDVQIDGKLAAIETHPPEASRLASEDRYLCARFVKNLNKQNSPWLRDLCRIASIGLLTEVIQDFRKPTSAVKRSDLVIYLDAPVAMDALGLSGRAARENIEPILTNLRSIGCQVRIFRTSVDEIQRVLRVMLSFQPVDRTGATANAMRRNEVLEKYAIAVRNDAHTFLREHAIQIVDQDLIQFPHSHEYFPMELNRDLYAAIAWHLEPAPREHDSAVLTLVMRKRGANQSSDIFQAKHIFITKNGFLSQLARRFCIDRGLIQRNEAPPAIHQRQLATMAWLRTGLDSDAEVPRRYLLAACERVLEMKKSMVEKARLAVSGLSAEQQQQLELLLQQDRSVQIIMDKTLGSSSVIDDRNMPELLEAMKRTLVADIEVEKSKETASVRRAANAKIAAANEARDEAEARAFEMAAQLAAISASDRRLLEAAATAANRRVRWFRVVLNSSVSIILLLFAAVPLIGEFLPNSARYLLLVFGGAVSLVMGGLQLWDRKTRLGEAVEWYANRTLHRLVAERGLSEKISASPLVFANGQYSCVPSPPSPSDQFRLQ